MFGLFSRKGSIASIFVLFSTYFNFGFCCKSGVMKITISKHINNERRIFLGRSTIHMEFPHKRNE